MQKIKIVRDQALAENVIIIDGLTATGKSLLAPICSAFERSEQWLVNHLYEELCFYEHAGLIDFDAVKSLIRLNVDLDQYNIMISRNTNFRKTDDSGVYKSFLQDRYLARLDMPDGDVVVERIQKEKPLLFLMTHYMFPMSKALFAALGARLKLFMITTRHPYWVVENWFQRHFSERIGKDPREFQVTYDYKGRPLPWIAYGWEEKYVASTPLEQAIYFVDHLMSGEDRKLASLDAETRKKILFVPFERFTLEHERYIGSICSTLGTKTTPIVDHFVKQNGLPRTFTRATLEEKRDGFAKLLRENQISKDAENTFARICGEYEKRYLDFLN